MKLPSDTAEAVAEAARQWAESASSLPLVIRKTPDGVVCATVPVQARYTKTAFAQALNLCRNTFRKVETRLGLTPASDGQYTAETVEWAKQQLAQEENRKSPHVLARERKNFTL